MKRVLCWLKAIPLWLRCGAWVPHIYGESEYEKAIIIATETGFRVSDSLMHESGETVHKDACLIRCRCVNCGREDVSWYHSWDERWKLEA